MKLMGKCPACGVTMEFTGVTDGMVVACPNRIGGCGRTWYAAGRQHYMPQSLRVHLPPDSSGNASLSPHYNPAPLLSGGSLMVG